MLPMDPTILHQRRVEVLVVCKINLSIEHWKDYLVVEEVVQGVEAGGGVAVEEEEGIGNFIAVVMWKTSDFTKLYQNTNRT